MYHNPGSPAEVQHARELHERIRREFPEFRIYRFFEKPIGPHTLAMFEVNTFTPTETGALFGFLTVWRGPLSCVSKPHRPESNSDRRSQIGYWCIQTLVTRSETTLSWQTGWAKKFHSISTFSNRVLVHPNTGDALGDHTVPANWMGKEVPLSFNNLS